MAAPSSCGQAPTLGPLEHTSPPDWSRIGLGVESDITSVTEKNVSYPELLFLVIKEKK